MLLCLTGVEEKIQMINSIEKNIWQDATLILDKNFRN